MLIVDFVGVVRGFRGLTIHYCHSKALRQYEKATAMGLGNASFEFFPKEEWQQRPVVCKNNGSSNIPQLLSP